MTKRRTATKAKTKRKAIKKVDGIKLPNGVILALVLTADCEPHPDNYNEHPQRQIDYLENSIDQFDGQIRPIVVQKKKKGKGYYVIAGNGFWQAAWNKGISELGVAIVPDHWSYAKAKAYMPADNYAATLSEQNQAKLDAIVQHVHKAEGKALALLAAGTEAALAGVLAKVSGSRAGFLDDLVGEGNNTHNASVDSPYVQLNYAVTKEQRTLVLEALKAAKEKWDVITSIEALVNICDAFMAGVAVDG